VPSATDHAEKLLAAIIPERRDLLDRALRHLTTEHFTDPVHRNLFVLLERYAEVTGAIITRDALVDQLTHSRADPGKLAQYTETYDLLVALSSDEADFRWSLNQLRDLAADRSTRDALTRGMEILTRGVDTDKGETLQGHVEARTAVLQSFAEIDRNLSMMEAPEGDMRAEADDILADYALAEANRLHGRSTGIPFGIPALDDKLGGVRPGELALIAGYTSEGKTSLVVQLAWNAAVSGHNVVVLTTETLRSQVRRRIISRHSCLEAFGITSGATVGLNSKLVKDGTLSQLQKTQLSAVVSDFTRNPGYGACYIVQVPRQASISYIEAKLVRIQRQLDIELVIMDYLALLKPDRKRQSDREELGNLLKEAKQLATTFNDGAGVPFVSPWQVNRTNRDIAERSGFYTPQALSETAEASNSPDVIVTLLAPLDNDKRICPIRMQILKARDAEKANNIEISVDYATSRFFTAGDGPALTVDPWDPSGLL
jgi:replicative DNA helicase